MSQPHSRLRQALIKDLKESPEVLEAFAVETTTVSGVPDIYVQGATRHLWIECKVNDDLYTPIQKYVGLCLGAYRVKLKGGVYYVAALEGSRHHVAKAKFRPILKTRKKREVIGTLLRLLGGQ